MNNSKWTPTQLKRLEEAYKSKPAWETDRELAGKLASAIQKSTDAIRWKMRQIRFESVKVKSPKILVLDIETLPIEALVWDVWKQDIHPEQIEKDWSVLCWSAKWLFDTKVMGGAVTVEEAMEHEDVSVLPDIWNLLNNAQVVITHNGDNFDFKRLNARFFIHGFPPPMHYKSIDTLKIAKENLSLTYNKLDWIAQIVGIGRKIETGFKWWKECHNGNQKYIDLMLKYNKWDVNLEEEVYLRLRPWMKSHPNMAVYSVENDIAHCPACGGVDLHWNGQYSTPLGLYKAFRCQDCGSIGRSTKKQYKLNGSIAQN
jgi:hypothetical protein